METVSYDGSFRNKRRVILSNDKHGTTIALMSNPLRGLTRNQVKRSREQLCGIEGCECNKDLGIHGPQAYDVFNMSQEGWIIRSKQHNLF